MQPTHSRILLIALACLGAATFGHAQSMVVAPDRSNGRLSGWGRGALVGGNGAEPTTWPAARYTLKSGGLTDTGHGDLTFSNNVATLETKFEAPGTMLVEVKWKPEGFGDRAVAARWRAGKDPARRAAAEGF